MQQLRKFFMVTSNESLSVGIFHQAPNLQAGGAKIACEFIQLVYDRQMWQIFIELHI